MMSPLFQSRPRRRTGFTLVEVVVALAILSMALAGFFAIAQSAAQRADKAYQSWHRMHLLSQAAEYYLLFADEDPPSMPIEIFDEPDYLIQVSYSDAEGLPEESDNLEGQAPLRTLTIELLRASDHQVLDTLKIDRIDYDADTGLSQ